MILLQRWVAGRVRTPGRFWRTVRRIDERSIDFVTAWTRMLMAFLCLLIIVAMSGCANYASIEVEHVSHPLAGRPFFGDAKEEDSLNQLNICTGESRGWYYEGCLGYVIGDTGFYGPRLSFTARLGKRFSFEGR